MLESGETGKALRCIEAFGRVRDYVGVRLNEAIDGVKTVKSICQKILTSSQLNSIEATDQLQNLQPDCVFIGMVFMTWRAVQFIVRIATCLKRSQGSTFSKRQCIPKGPFTPPEKVLNS